jgi:hypothetical protein
VIVRDFDVHGFDARPRERAWVAAVGQQHVRGERRLVGRVAVGRAEAAGSQRSCGSVRWKSSPATRSTTLARAGNFSSAGLSSVCRDEAASAADGSANGTRKWRRRSCMMVRAWQTRA